MEAAPKQSGGTAYSGKMAEKKDYDQSPKFCISPPSHKASADVEKHLHKHPKKCGFFDPKTA
jgi:hypothetical protein